MLINCHLIVDKHLISSSSVLFMVSTGSNVTVLFFRQTKYKHAAITLLLNATQQQERETRMNHKISHTSPAVDSGESLIVPYKVERLRVIRCLADTVVQHVSRAKQQPQKNIRASVAHSTVVTTKANRYVVLWQYRTSPGE